MLHREHHLIERIGWLRAAVLGANDGIISTASLVVGVGAAARSAEEVVVAGVAGLVAGAMSMAAGEYVSVSSQSDPRRPILRVKPPSWPDSPRRNWRSSLRSMSTVVLPPISHCRWRGSDGEGCAGSASAR